MSPYLKCLAVVRLCRSMRVHPFTIYSLQSGASALWALAGITRHQQQRIASMIGINILVDMLMLKSETLQFIAGMAIIALTTENIENQNKIVTGGGIQPLVRLLRSQKTSEKVSLNYTSSWCCQRQREIFVKSMGRGKTWVSSLHPTDSQFCAIHRNCGNH